MSLNSHPLTPYSLDPFNARVLTHGRFLKGVSLISLTRLAFSSVCKHFYRVFEKKEQQTWNHKSSTNLK